MSGVQVYEGDGIVPADPVGRGVFYTMRIENILFGGPHRSPSPVGKIFLVHLLATNLNPASARIGFNVASDEYRLMTDWMNAGITGSSWARGMGGKVLCDVLLSALDRCPIRLHRASVTGIVDVWDFTRTLPYAELVAEELEMLARRPEGY
jgi:hypothetical protein